MIIQSVLFGVLAAIGWGIADFVAAVVSKKMGVLRTAVGVHVVSIAATTAYLFVSFDVDEVSLVHWISLAGIGILAFVTYLLFYKALQTGPVAIISPIVSTYAVVVIFLAIVFAGERLSFFQSIGASVTILGVIAASVNLNALRSGERVIGIGVLLGILATLSIGTWQYGIAITSREVGWFLTIYASRVVTLALLTPLVIATRSWPWQKLTIPLAIGVLTIGIVETAGIFAFARGAEIGVISIVAAASITYPIIPMVGGLVIFRERLTAMQFGGLAFALIGLLVLTLGG